LGLVETKTGQHALCLLPHMAPDIHRVMEDQSFEIHDAMWIAKVIGGCIRISVADRAFEVISSNQPGLGLHKDCLYGEGNVLVHMFFSYKQGFDQTDRLFGHYDLLSPKQSPVSILLPTDAAWC